MDIKSLGQKRKNNPKSLSISSSYTSRHSHALSINHSLSQGCCHNVSMVAFPAFVVIRELQSKKTFWLQQELNEWQCLSFYLSAPQILITYNYSASFMLSSFRCLLLAVFSVSAVTCPGNAHLETGLDQVLGCLLLAVFSVSAVNLPRNGSS